jgi:uncharacterized cofD-like protein
MRPLRIVTIGGGTGTHMLLSGLKKYVPEVELSAIVTVADTGGSTGRLRDAFGFLPVGDSRMALTALATDSDAESLLRDLFQYRFSKGDGLTGHNFGNLFLTALTDLLGSEEQALLSAGKLLHACGNVIPVAGEKLNLLVRYDNGVVAEGEAIIDTNGMGLPPATRILKVWIEPEVRASRFAREAIHEATHIILGPGDLYTSTIANLVVPGIRDALMLSDASIIVIPSLMTKTAQTSKMTLSMQLTELERYSGRRADVVLLNKTSFPESLLDHYAKEQEFPFFDDLPKGGHIIRGDLLYREKIVKEEGDTLRRSLLRHDPHKVAAAIMNAIRR